MSVKAAGVSDALLRRLHVIRHGRAGADEVPVAKDVVDARHRRPVLVVRIALQGEEGLLLRVGVLPVAQQQAVGVGRVLQHVVELVGLALLHLGDLLADLDHGIAEAVELALPFRLGGLDHQRVGHREGHGGGVEAIVDEALGHVLDREAGAFLQPPEVDDAFMRHEAAGTLVEHREMRIEPPRHVVGVEDRHHRRPLQPLAAHHGDVGP